MARRDNGLRFSSRGSGARKALRVLGSPRIAGYSDEMPGGWGYHHARAQEAGGLCLAKRQKGRDVTGYRRAPSAAARRPAANRPVGLAHHIQVLALTPSGDGPMNEEQEEAESPGGPPLAPTSNQSNQKTR